jgi:hypothetical protein
MKAKPALDPKQIFDQIVESPTFFHRAKKPSKLDGLTQERLIHLGIMQEEQMNFG